MELAAEIGRAQPSRLIMAAISAVFTIGYVATLLGEDENWIFDLSISMCPEDGCLWVHGVGENGVPAFTRDGIENLRQIIADERAADRGPTLRRSPNAYLDGARIDHETQLALIGQAGNHRLRKALARSPDDRGVPSGGKAAAVIGPTGQA
ncbi:MAG TPA: hypothetical protein VFE64_00965, partial [Devosia sp.]|nr:hypothetical protein [Devosia sp.]